MPRLLASEGERTEIGFPESKAAGEGTGTSALETAIQLKEEAADEMEAIARQKISAVGTPGSKEAEAALGAQYKASAEAAMKAQAEARERQMQIADWQNAPAWQRSYANWRFIARYGHGTTYDQARGIEQGTIDTSQQAINQYASFQVNAARRARQRDVLESGTSQLDEVKKLRFEIEGMKEQAGIRRTETARYYTEKFGGEGVIVPYMVIAAQFESLLDPFIIMFSVPFTFVGVIVAFVLTGITLNILSFLGMVMLMGIVVTNAIVLISYINILRARGYSMFKAITIGGRDRLQGC